MDDVQSSSSTPYIPLDLGESSSSKNVHMPQSGVASADAPPGAAAVSVTARDGFVGTAKAAIGQVMRRMSSERSDPPTSSQKTAFLPPPNATSSSSTSLSARTGGHAFLAAASGPPGRQHTATGISTFRAGQRVEFGDNDVHNNITTGDGHEYSGAGGGGRELSRFDDGGRNRDDDGDATLVDERQTLLDNRPPAPRRRQESEVEDHHYFSDVGTVAVPVKKPRAVKKRADVQSSIRESVQPAGDVWASACCGQFMFSDLLQNAKNGKLSPEVLSINTAYTEVVFCQAFGERMCFVFRFGCVVGWDMPARERSRLIQELKPYMKDPMTPLEEDDMDYVWSDYRAIRQDIIHLISQEPFERLSYSYGFAQSVKLSYFETRVDLTIERTKLIPEGLASTGKIKSNREDISRRIGELFISRFYINLHTDFLDTPDIFWEFDEYSDFYSSCRSYLEIPKRVEILNQRLDIIKDMYDMLNNELTIQHGYKLEWIVIYLICVEVVIEVIWNILVRDLLKLV